jgi:hypothetical protein
MLLGSGSTVKQIKAATKQVAQLNQERWKVCTPSRPLAPPSDTFFFLSLLRVPSLAWW